MTSKKKVWYLGLEPLKARYTGQLTEDWMPAAFNQFKEDVDFISVPGDYDPDQEIKVGAVLDAVGNQSIGFSCDEKRINISSCVVDVPIVVSVPK